VVEHHGDHRVGAQAVDILTKAHYVSVPW
jgi:hypothetical protein